MRVCLVSPAEERGEAAAARQLAALLARRHEVTLIHSGTAPPPADPGPVRELVAAGGEDEAIVTFAGEDHRRSAAVMATIERAYGAEGPDYIEVLDRGAHGLVPLMSRRCGGALLRETRIAVRLHGTGELLGLHDGTLGNPGASLPCALEREQLRLADRLLWPGGDGLGAYRRYYGFAMEGAQVGVPFADAEPPAWAEAADGPLRILWAAPLRRHLGVLDLAHACLRLPRDDWQLTLIGADTRTAHGGQSVRMAIERMFGGDPRLRIEEPPADGDLGALWAEQDLFVLAPRFAVWPEAALAAMRAGLPLLATPVGGMPALVAAGETGWLSEGVGSEALRRSLLELLGDRGRIAAVRESGRPRERFLRLTDPERVLAAYDELLAAAPRRGAAVRVRSEPPLVTGVVPYFRAAAHVEEAVASLLAQTHPRIEVVVVNDGSYAPEDEVLTRLVQPGVRVVNTLNEGESSARNLGATLARGEYVVMLDSDNALEPEFVSRALAVFEREPDLAYVSCWLRFVGPDGSRYLDPAGYAPLGNRLVDDDEDNWDGDTLALLPRGLFTELGYRFDPAAVIYSDWELYRRLRDDGRYGVVIPERLARYRVLPDSLQRAHTAEMQRVSWEDARARRILRRTRWSAGREENGSVGAVARMGDDGGREEELLRINAELAAELRALSRGDAAAPRSAPGPASRAISRLEADRDELAGELRDARAALERLEEHNQELGRQIHEQAGHIEALSGELARLRTGLGGALRRLRARTRKW